MTSVEVVIIGTDTKKMLFLHVFKGKIIITPPSGLLNITPANARRFARMLLQAAEKVADE